MYTYGSTHSIFMAVCVQVQTTTCRDIQMTNEIQPTRLTGQPVHLMYYQDYIWTYGMDCTKIRANSCQQNTCNKL